MVWWQLTTFKTDFVVINENLNTKQYIEQVLCPVVVLIFLQCHGLKFQHGNGRPHMARLTRNFLKVIGIDILSWPAQSLDCNPIGHMWDFFGHCLCHYSPQPQTVECFPLSYLNIFKLNV